MHIIETPAYRKAFVRYLRRGTPIDVSLKAYKQEHPTTHYIWHTRGDDKVRPSHAANNGRIFAWNDPPATGHPGEAYGCRCWAEPYYGFDNAPIHDPPLESVYPEAFIIPLLRIPRLIAAWQAWLRAREASRNWQLSSTKSVTKWRNQIEKGNWTPEKITRTIRYGQRFKARNERTGGDATRYELDGGYVVRDDTTGNILQVSRPDHLPKLFK